MILSCLVCSCINFLVLEPGNDNVEMNVNMLIEGSDSWMLILFFHEKFNEP